jgi:hypothetical protein
MFVQASSADDEIDQPGEVATISESTTALGFVPSMLARHCTHVSPELSNAYANPFMVLLMCILVPILYEACPMLAAIINLLAQKLLSCIERIPGVSHIRHKRKILPVVTEGTDSGSESGSGSVTPNQQPQKDEKAERQRTTQPPLKEKQGFLAAMRASVAILKNEAEAKVVAAVDSKVDAAKDALASHTKKAQQETLDKLQSLLGELEANQETLLESEFGAKLQDAAGVVEELIETPEEAMFHNILHLVFSIWAMVGYIWGLSPKADMSTADGFMCKAIHIVAMPMYKPFSVSMWVVLMASVSMCHWAMHRHMRPKDITGIPAGKQPMSNSWLTLNILTIVNVLFFLWVAAALIFMPAAIVFLPWSFALVVGSLVMMRAPYVLLRWIQTKLGEYKSKEPAGGPHEPAPAMEGGQAQLLVLKINVAIIICTFIAMCWCSEFYLGRMSWMEVMAGVTELISISISLDVPQLVLGWPSSLDLHMQLPLQCSASALALQYGLLLFRWLCKNYRLLDESERQDDANKTKGSVDDVEQTNTATQFTVPAFVYEEVKGMSKWEPKASIRSLLVYAGAKCATTMAFALEKLIMTMNRRANRDKNVRDQSFSHVTASLVLEQLTNNPAMDTLELSSCKNLLHLSEDATAFFTSVARKGAQLTSLNLECCWLSGDFSPPSFVLIAMGSHLICLLEDQPKLVHQPSYHLILCFSFRNNS